MSLIILILAGMYFMPKITIIIINIIFAIACLNTFCVGWSLSKNLLKDIFLITSILALFMISTSMFDDYIVKISFIWILSLAVLSGLGILFKGAAYLWSKE